MLRVLRQRFSELEFTWLMGADNLEKFYLWEEYQEIISSHNIIVFDRPNAIQHFYGSKFGSSYMLENSLRKNEKIIYCYGVKIEISSTQIRQIKL